MKKLWNEKEILSDEGINIASEMSKVAREILKKYSKEYSLRELSHLFITEISCEESFQAMEERVKEWQNEKNQKDS